MPFDGVNYFIVSCVHSTSKRNYSFGAARNPSGLHHPPLCGPCNKRNHRGEAYLYLFPSVRILKAFYVILKHDIDSTDEDTD